MQKLVAAILILLCASFVHADDPTRTITIHVHVFANEHTLKHSTKEEILRRANLSLSLYATTLRGRGIELHFLVETEVSPFTIPPKMKNPSPITQLMPSTSSGLTILVTDTKLEIPYKIRGSTYYDEVMGWSENKKIIAKINADDAPLEHTIAHEVGHVFGLDHSTNPHSVMCNFRLYKCIGSSLELDSADIDRLERNLSKQFQAP